MSPTQIFGVSDPLHTPASDAPADDDNDGDLIWPLSSSSVIEKY